MWIAPMEPFIFINLQVFNSHEQYANINFPIDEHSHPTWNLKDARILHILVEIYPVKSGIQVSWEPVFDAWVIQGSKFCDPVSPQTTQMNDLSYEHASLNSYQKLGSFITIPIYETTYRCSIMETIPEHISINKDFQYKKLLSNIGTP